MDSKFFSPLSKFYVGMSKIYVGSINFFSRFNQKFMWVQSNFYTNLSYYFILSLCRQIKVPCFADITSSKVPPRSARSTSGVQLLRSCTRWFGEKERGSYKSHPSYFIYTIYYRNSDKCTQFDF